MRNLINTVNKTILPTSIKRGYDDCTTTYEGRHYPNSSAFFISQIPTYGHLAYSMSEFVKWLICGNKASNRTNNASRSYAVVETISHPLQGRNLFTNKTYETNKMNPINSLKTLLSPLFAVVFAMGVAYA